MARPRRTKRDAPERKPKKKVSILDTERIIWVDYKDVALLRRFMSERAKIRARRVTGNDAQQQRAVARAIRVAREMALLPYSVRQVTHRNKGKRDRGDGGTLSARSEPMPIPPDGETGPGQPAADVTEPEVTESLVTEPEVTEPEVAEPEALDSIDPTAGEPA
jgi:small subunit ribosomal protein S18